MFSCPMLGVSFSCPCLSNDPLPSPLSLVCALVNVISFNNGTYIMYQYNGIDSLVFVALGFQSCLCFLLYNSVLIINLVCTNTCHSFQTVIEINVVSRITSEMCVCKEYIMYRA